jgi:peptidyl-prolyl cis-trans isomerase A (cyclophilin A)
MNRLSTIVLAGAVAVMVLVPSIAWAGQQPPAAQPAGQPPTPPPAVQPATQQPPAQPGAQPAKPAQPGQPAGQPATPPPAQPVKPPPAAEPVKPLPPATTQPAIQKAEEMKPKLSDRVYVKMVTSMGDLVIELNQEKAPISVQNFLAYADEGFYNGTIFHRVIPNFVIQGGGYDAELKQKPTKAAIKNEWTNGLKNVRGTLSMARLPMQPDSATSQFFISVKDNTPLDTPRDGAGYAVFGKVIQGLDVVDKIKGVATTRKESATKDMMSDVPVEPVIIKSVARVEPDAIKDAIAAAQAAEAEEAKKKAEEANKKMEAFKADWNKATDFVKSRGADPTKGTTTQTGLWLVDVTAGTGETPKPTDRVKVHYTGWLPDGTKFDSSVDRGQPAELSLNRVIKGWTEGMSTMKVGGKRYLIIPPELGYGAGGQPPKIPPSSVLVFEIELLGISTDQPAQPQMPPQPPPSAGQPQAPKPGQPATPSPTGQPPAPKPVPPVTPKPVQPTTPPPAGQPQPPPKPAQPTP